MPETQSTAAAPSGVDLTPRPATSHVRVITDTSPIVPPRRRPIAPWRFVIAATAVLLAIPVGIYAAAPVRNGADLAVLMVLAMFVAAFTPGRN